jgi:hypothetical protein
MHNYFVIIFEDLARWEGVSVPRDIQETKCDEQQILFKYNHINFIKVCIIQTNQRTGYIYLTYTPHVDSLE